MRQILVVLAALGACFASTRTARACWDGYSATTEHVWIGVPGDPEWSPARARNAATWLVRLQALLPSDVRVDSFGDFATVCRVKADGECGATIAETKHDAGRLDLLFKAVARAVGTSSGATRKARLFGAKPVTVQVFSAHERTRAVAVAKRLNDESIGEHGFLNAGGFPANNGVAHVLDERDARGAPIHRVVVGAFLRAADAAPTVSDVTKRAGLVGFVRAL